MVRKKATYVYFGHHIRVSFVFQFFDWNISKNNWKTFEGILYLVFACYAALKNYAW